MLAEFGLVEDFYEAIDSDDIPPVISLIKKATMDKKTIEITVRKDDLSFDAGERSS